MIATVVVLAGIIIGVTYLTSGGTTPSGTESPRPSASPSDTTTPDPDGGEDGDDVEVVPTPSSEVLTEPLGGQEAIDALGDKIEIVAQRNGKTVEQLEELLLRDKAAKVSTDGYIVYIDSKNG